MNRSDPRGLLLLDGILATCNHKAGKPQSDQTRVWNQPILDVRIEVESMLKSYTFIMTQSLELVST